MSIEIKFPSEQERAQSIDHILEQGLPEKLPFMARMKEIFVGPGLKAVFYESKLAFIISMLIYVSLLALFFLMGGYLGGYVENEEYIVILLFPVFHIIFHTVSCWAEGEDSVIELKESLYYSFFHLICLRMLYFSIFSALVNTLVFTIPGPMEHQAKICAVGLSSLFLFSVVTLMLYQRFREYTAVSAAALFWNALCLIGSHWGGSLSRFLLETVPLVVHLMMLLISFSLLVCFVGKVGEKYAYTYEYH